MNPYAIPGLKRKHSSEEEKIKRKVCRYYGIEELSEDIWARQVAMWIVRKKTKKSYQKIGEMFEVTHDCCRYSVKVVQDRVEVYPEKFKEVKSLMESVYQ